MCSKCNEAQIYVKGYIFNNKINRYNHDNTHRLSSIDT